MALPFARIEGYWRSQSEPHYPMPIAQAEPVSRDFLYKLRKIESRLYMEHYKGSSKCRICGIDLGNGEYQLGRRSSGWAWPQGLMHYLIMHNVHPSAQFVTAIETFYGPPL